MTFTGGPLNELNGKMGISAPNKSVPVMKLIRMHKPKSREELVELIRFHAENNCKCGVKSKGTVRDFGVNLYNAQIEYWGEFRFSLKECIQWEYDLFVAQSLKGNLVENKAIRILKGNFPQLSIREARDYFDEELRIDILIGYRDKVLCGIQVKPATFNKMRSGVILFNKTANEKWGKPVYYLFYNEKEDFININDVFRELQNLATDSHR
jgi:hypothetical protein